MAEFHLLSPRGFRAGAVYAGIKSKQTPDVAMLACDVPAAAAAVFTTNRVCAAPVEIGRQHVAGGKLRAVIVNSGNANACTGKQGLRDALHMCALVAEKLRCPVEQVLPSSTGIIGHLLPMEKVEAGIAAVVENLGDDPEHATAFADGILTTDLVRKVAGAELKIGGKRITVAGVCKGSGMIGPRMALDGKKHATMLAFLTTDAGVRPAILRRLLAAAADRSFNAVTVDSHTSTNDTAAILASGLSGAAIDSPAARKKFAEALDEVCQSLAYQIAADGEGATKVFTVTVRGAKSESAAKAMARAIADSPLVKCAIHGNDPNWGRIVSAAGYAGVPFEPDRAVLTLAGAVVFRHGRPAAFDADKLSAALHAKEVRADLNCRMGEGSATVWTCDLSREYIRINADYHT
ncbi:MAG TPA: bifunctional glutamate N-acetyltransferase/amino-acid acetyltransferase ArgJ [Tepidisphaeraceae bacterium]|jgi:glutamate N-acetyltransferase/amino-acid N-acetyltransferase|nr:bifunctional glutamate N-acetyltransferase/amino-acid acetyltransferase ArgJ [Tepidisphaeraceae bacterium]